MSLTTGKQLLLSSAAGAAAGYQISRSLRFNSSDSAYLSRTPASAGNRKTWTWAGWVKKVNNTTSRQFIFNADSTSQNSTIEFKDNAISVFDYNSGAYQWQVVTAAVFRDNASWMHLVVSVDTTQSTASNRVKIYINGTQQTAFSTANYPTQNYDSKINAALDHRIGSISGDATFNLDAYLADIHFIDGQALTPSSFTETDANGVLQPKAYTGSYGTNGFKLAFSDNATAAALGTDTSGNGNTWTVNNLSVTAGAGNDSLVDSPTNYGTDTGAGGEVRGNYATLNPLINPSVDTFSNGNLQVTTSSSNYGTSVSTIAIPSTGKWYAECTITATASYAAVGICSVSSVFTATSWIGSFTGVTYYGNTGNKYVNGTGSSYGASYGVNDVIGIAYDADSLQITFYKNNSSQGTITGVSAGTYYFGSSEWDPASGTQVWNFGQRQWAYQAPAGFKALCTQNLPAPTITKPETVFDVKLYTGNGGNQTISGYAFSPDLVWIKQRSGTTDHGLFDTVRGVTLQLRSNTTAGDNVVSNALTSFTSDGYVLGGDGPINANGLTYVNWCWDAGSSTVTNNSGSISSQVRANASAGFSVITWTGTGSSATIGHGLSVAPKFFISKRRDISQSWITWHTGIGANNNFLRLETTAAAASDAGMWQGQTPSSTLVYLGTDGGVNASGGTYVGYCFAPVAGYSAFGTYAANNSADGPFIYTGFRPKLVIVKCYDSTSDWALYDSARGSYNTIGDTLLANSSNQENNPDYGNIDFLSNGFKIRSGSGYYINNTPDDFIYCAWAESPFAYARAR